MSYEGYEQHLCQNGHLYQTTDSYHWNDSGDNGNCTECQAPSAFVNAVDDTNCDAFGIITDAEWEKLLIAPAVHDPCPTCHHVKITPACYQVPQDPESLRHYWDSQKQAYVKISTLKKVKVKKVKVKKVKV